MRLDKLLANKAYGSRKEVHQLIKDRRVTINGSITTKKDTHIDIDVEKFQKEQYWLGVGISQHPLLVLSKNPLYPIVSLSELSEGQTATVLVEIQSIRVIRTKKGVNMAFLKVTDSKTNLEVTVFSDQYRQFKNLLHEGRFFR